MPVGDRDFVGGEELDLEVEQRGDRENAEGHVHDQHHHELRDAIGLGAGEDLREHIGVHPIAGRVLGSRFHLVGRDGVGELAVFPRQNDVLNEEREVDEHNSAGAY